MKNFPNHLKKLEKLEWTLDQDIPHPDGIKPTDGRIQCVINDECLIQHGGGLIQIIISKGFDMDG